MLGYANLTESQILTGYRRWRASCNDAVPQVGDLACLRDIKLFESHRLTAGMLEQPHAAVDRETSP